MQRAASSNIGVQSTLFRAFGLNSCHGALLRTRLVPISSYSAAGGRPGGDWQPYPAVPLPNERPKGDFQRATDAATDAIKNLEVPDLGKLNVDIKKTLNWNFAVQLALTAVSWAIAFFTSHATLAKGAGVQSTTALLLVGVALSGYSAYLSYSYLAQANRSGLDVLQGWRQLKLFYDHMIVNFVGAGVTILALQAEVGAILLGGTKSGLAVVALAQASANTLLAHLVSIVFLTFMIRKITVAYQHVLEWGENLAKNLPRY